MDEKAFDAWAGDYDERIMARHDQYPFEGYYSVLGKVVKAVEKIRNPKVLELGVGTGTLSFELQKQGALITGVDFSGLMLAKAQEKLGAVDLYQEDLRIGLPPEIQGQKYDFIVSTYTLHHIPDATKGLFLRHLLDYLAPGGMIIIGDISYKCRQDYLASKAENLALWDGEEGENYFVYSEHVDWLEKLFHTGYDQISSCAGILWLKDRL